MLARNGTVSVRNDDTAHFDLTLQRGASVSGRVLYSDGSPASQVQISIENINAKPVAPKDDMPAMFENMSAGAFMSRFLLHQSTGTDDRGNFRIAGPQPGTYRVAAASQPSQNNPGDDGRMLFFNGVFSDPHALLVYSGDTLHKNAAKTYKLRAGDDLTGVDITIPIDAFHRVDGQLTALGGTPVPVAKLTLTDTSDASFTLSTSPARDGTFVFATVPSGTYKLSAAGAVIGAVPDALPPGMPVQANMLVDPHALADGATSVIVQDSDVSEASLQLTAAPQNPTAGQPNTVPAPQ